MADFYSQISSNNRLTYFFTFLMILLTAVNLYIVSLLFFGEPNLFGILIIVLISILSTAILYFQSDKLILMQAPITKISKDEYPELFNMVEALSLGAGIPTPDLYIMEDRNPNAFAVGRGPGKSSIVITRGLRDILNKQELEGVLAHEISHIKNRDTRLMTIAIGLFSIISTIAYITRRSLFYGSRRRNKGGGFLLLIGLFFVILSPFLAKLIQLAISRKREYAADATAVSITRNPNGLIGALKKIQNFGSRVMAANEMTAPLYFSNPLKQGFMSGLFSTHPPIEKRIEMLKQSMGQGTEQHFI